MDKWNDLKKKGWHPEKGGTVTGLGLRNKAKGMAGRGDSSADLKGSDHVAAPLSSLRDPASFAPPPKRDPTQPLPASTGPYAPAPPTSARPTPQPPARSASTASQQQLEGVAEPAPRSSKGWQLDTTGLSTSHLPPPPGRTGTPTSTAPPPAYSPTASRAPAARGPPPSLPPRLPPRSGTSSPVRTGSSAPPPRAPAQTHLDTQSRAENGYLNQGAMNRLGAAGISVSSLGIGGGGNTSPPAAAAAPAPAQGTTWQQKQAALRTASQFHKDPSSISFADAKTAAGTANNFRQRHGEQVAGGLRTANSLGQRFGITEQAKAGDSPVTSPGAGTAGAQQQPARAVSVASLASAIGKKKPPAPPPPRKKPELGGNAGAPPPVPLSTRPTF
ncbi:hypothetical protein BKA67DRAFT_269204 [Truncatella angustata]|uniref:GMP synthase n=1 Tax=Truncatella angustata TaxID=152316 RepID=A0A9P8UL35_9PEZI|nr:uncharacterized protein BKA67DRAFT_269204 [Truncatella angustata]KAH6654061.1 hypothetical protein BKA67DRAFT_269204 [Truncatella angustata]